MKSFNDLVELAVNTKRQTSHAVNLTLDVQNNSWKAYEAIVSQRDILFFCDHGTVTYVVDSYGDRHFAELFDWSGDDLRREKS